MGNRSTCLLAVTTCVAAACGGRDDRVEAPDPERETAASSQIHIPQIDPDLCDPSGKEVVTYDLNHDGEPNLWELYATVEQGGTEVRVLTCKQVDFDGDGQKDYVAIYRESGELLAEEFDLTFDGHFDVRTHYDESTGNVFLAERDTGLDGEPDVWESYDADGNLELVERDRNGDGRPDMWEQYEKGELVALLYDDTADGRVDRREERPRPEDDGEAADAPAGGEAADAPAGGEAADAPAGEEPAGGGEPAAE